MKLSIIQKNRHSRNLATALVLAGGLLLSGQASAASQCKGLQNEACAEQASSCSWVHGYERKDGRKVNAFCRSKAKRVTKQAVKNTKQSG